MPLIGLFHGGLQGHAEEVVGRAFRDVQIRIVVAAKGHTQTLMCEFLSHGPSPFSH